MTNYVFTVPFKPARGRVLTRMAKHIGVRRKWLGLEPDFMLRRRVSERLQEWLRETHRNMGFDA